MTRRMRGEGTVARRADGRWVGAAYITTTADKRKRIYVYAKTQAAAQAKLAERITSERRGVRTPEQAWTVGEYIEHYLETVAKNNVRPTTLEQYRNLARNHLVPMLGAADLRTLNVARLQVALNNKLANGTSLRTVHAIRSFLRSVLSQAEREELVVRNVAKLVRLKAWKRKPIRPWTADEAIRFLEAARGHRWYGAFLMMLLYGMRRGEILGLTWDNVDLDGATFEVFQQLQRIDGELQLVPVKTDASNRALPVLPVVAQALRTLPRPDTPEACNLVFTSSAGTPIDPKNFTRAFEQRRASAELRRITLHATRHTTATLLKRFGVPDRDIQSILGHTHVSTTQQLYQHGDVTVQREGLSKLEDALLHERVVVKNVVTPEFSTGQSTNSRVLTSVNSGDHWRQDTLLKRCSEVLDTTTLTSVSGRLQTRTNRYFLGFAVVRIVVKPDSNHEAHEARWRAYQELREVCHAMDIERTRRACFPNNLLSYTDPT